MNQLIIKVRDCDIYGEAYLNEFIIKDIIFSCIKFLYLYIEIRTSFNQICANYLALMIEIPLEMLFEIKNKNRANFQGIKSK